VQKGGTGNSNLRDRSGENVARRPRSARRDGKREIRDRSDITDRRPNSGGTLGFTSTNDFRRFSARVVTDVPGLPRVKNKAGTLRLPSSDQPLHRRRNPTFGRRMGSGRRSSLNCGAQSASERFQLNEVTKRAALISQPKVSWGRVLINFATTLPIPFVDVIPGSRSDSDVPIRDI
jgi:hypothetical protein